MEQVINAGDMKAVIEAGESSFVDEGVMTLKEDRWMMKTISPDKSILSACLVPEDALSEYEKGPEELVGINFDHFNSFIESKTSDLRIRVDGREMHLYEGDDHVRLATIDPDAVESAIPNAPDLSYEVKVTGDVGELTAFANKVNKFEEDGWIMFSPREEGLYMHSMGDNWNLDRRLDWDDFEDHELDWSANAGKEHKHGVTPEDEKGVDVIQGVDNIQPVNMPADTATIFFSNHMPTKLLFELDSGIKISYILSPRLPTTDSTSEMLPDRIRE